MHDITGHYNRFDVFSLNVNRGIHHPLTETSDLESQALSSGMGNMEEPEIEGKTPEILTKVVTIRN